MLLTIPNHALSPTPPPSPPPPFLPQFCLQDVPGNQTTLFQDLRDMWRYARWRMQGKFRSTYELEKYLICLGASDARFNQVSASREA